MDEFLKLYLTGRRAEDLNKLRRFRMVIGLLGALFAIIPVFVNLFGASNAPLSIALTVLGFLFEGAAVVLSFVQKKFVDALVELENAAIEIEKQGEERENYKKLYEAWRETFGKQNLRMIFSAVFTVVGFAILAAAVLLSTFLELPDIILPIACLVAAVVLATPTFMQATGEAKARAMLYEKAGREIDEIKRSKFGISERKIFSQSENARGYSMLPVPVAMFLKDGAEKEDFRIVNKRSGIVAAFLGVVFIVLIFLMGFWEEMEPTVAWTVILSVLAAALVLFFALALPLEGRKKGIYRRNYEKLTDSRSDTLRRELQGAWIRQQRRGNIMFLCFLIAPLVIGIVYGSIGHALGYELSLIVAIGSMFMICLIPAAILSLIIWTIMYAVYRKRVRPTEAELQKILEEERPDERR